MFEQTFKNIDDVLWKDAGCGSELDYVEQSSWVLFLKYLNDLEKERESVWKALRANPSPSVSLGQMGDAAKKRRRGGSSQSPHRR